MSYATKSWVVGPRYAELARPLSLLRCFRFVCVSFPPPLFELRSFASQTLLYSTIEGAITRIDSRKTSSSDYFTSHYCMLNRKHYLFPSREGTTTTTYRVHPPSFPAPKMRFSTALAILLNTFQYNKSEQKHIDHLVAQRPSEGQYYDIHSAHERLFPSQRDASSSERRFAANGRRRNEQFAAGNFRNARLGRSSIIGTATHRMEECDPHSSMSTTLNADVGVLSACGFGLYCVESTLSPTGGFCTPKTSFLSSSFSQADPTEEERGGTRFLQDNSTLFQRIRQYFCVPQAEYYRFCDCVADVATSTLDVSCTTLYDCLAKPSICGVNATDCVTYSFDFNVTGPTEYSRKTCYDFSRPYDQKVCYQRSVTNLTTVESCSIEFNGVICNSCQVELVEYEKCGLDTRTNQTTCYNTTTECYYFDCSNTEGGHSGSSCENDGIKIYDYLATYMCVDRCEICGTGINLTNPYGNMTIPGYDYEYNCGDLYYRGIYGYFTETECAKVTAVATVPCGCGAETMEGPSLSPPSDTPSSGCSLPSSQTSVMVMTMASLATIVLGTLALYAK